MAVVYSNPWVVRLQRRLSILADTASKESVQALAKWIGFNRKHAKAFSEALADAIADPSNVSSAGNTVGRQWLYLQILHESIILDSGTSRWDRFAEMREILGEGVMVEVTKKGCLDAANVKKVEGLVKQWDTLNVFGGPTMINLIKKQLANPPKDKPKDIPAESNTKEILGTPQKEEPKQASPTKPSSPKRENDGSPKEAQKIEKAEHENKEDSKSDSPERDSAAKAEPVKAVKKSVEYDFEAKDIPHGKVDPREFLAPCKAIATLQIARDMRNDSAVQLSSLLKGLPDDLKKMSDEADEHVKETGKSYQVPEKKARELSLKTSEKLLDMDLEEQIQNVRTFLEIVQKQREAREQLINLLVRSRCQFGANEAAKEFYRLDETIAKLQKVKETLQDGMALEGLDFEDNNPEKPKKETKLEPLIWFAGGEDYEGEPEAKRLKID